MKRIVYCIIGVVCIMTLSCNGQNSQQTGTNAGKVNKLDNINWVAADWKMETPDGIIIESWIKESDSLWIGASYFVLPNGDTASKESIRLTTINDTLYYMPTVSNQNDGKEVRFKETQLTDSSIVFENPVHDFPKQIVYIKTSDTTVHAYIAGNDKQLDFYYKKMH